MNDIWVCDDCKSINRRRDDHCYHCWAPRAGAMATPGLDLRAESAAAERSARTYVISWPLALVTVVLLAAVAILGIVLLRLQAADYPAMRQAFVDALTSGNDTVDQALTVQSVQLGLISLVRTGVTLLALLCFAGWLGLVTRNVPLLGGGTPSRSPVRVFVYALIPVWNLIRVPGMLQDLLYRVDPEGGGAFMVLAAWIGLVGSYFVSLIGGWVITWAGVRDLLPEVAAGDMGAVVATFGGVLDQSFWLGVAVALMVAVGTVLLAVLMIRVEVRCAARDGEIRARIVATGAPTPAAGPDWQPAAVAAHPALVASTPFATVAPARSAATPGATAGSGPEPARTAPAPYEPHWPAGRPWPGTPGSASTTSSTDPAAPLPRPSPAGAAPASPSPPSSPPPPPPAPPAGQPGAAGGPPGPPPPPPGAPRLR